MKPLLVLIGVFILSCAALYLMHHAVDFRLAGRIAMAAMLMFTSVAHFVFWRGMMLMIPGFIPFKKAMVYFTGALELLAAIGLLIPALYHLTGLLLVVFFIAILPSNITATRQQINLEKADYTGSGMHYLWFRVPLQLFFIGWVWWSASPLTP